MYSQYKQGQQQQQIYEYNAAVSRQKAEVIRQSGELKRQQMMKQKRRFASKQVAAYAGAGVGMVGTPLLLLADSNAEWEMDIMIQDYETRVGIANAQSTAELDIMRGDISYKSGILDAGTTLLTQIPNFYKR